MTCRCGESQRTEATHALRRTIAKITFVAEVKIDACARCREPNVPAALLIAFERTVAAELARRGPISGETFRWIRRATSLERRDLAHWLGVSVDTIASWEEERRAPETAAWLVIASIALDAIEGPRPMRTRLTAPRNVSPAPDTVVLAIDGAPAGTMAKVLDLLDRPGPFTDAHVADCLDLDREALAVRLRELATHGLVRSSEVSANATRWEVIERDRATLRRAAAELGVDLDALLPRPRAPEGTSGARQPAALPALRASSPPRAPSG